MKAHGLNQLSMVPTSVGATHVGFAATGPGVNGSPTRSGRSEPPDGTVLLCGTPRVTLNGWPLCSVRMPLTSQLPKIALRTPLVSMLAARTEWQTVDEVGHESVVGVVLALPHSASRFRGSCATVPPDVLEPKNAPLSRHPDQVYDDDQIQARALRFSTLSCSAL